MGLFMDDYFHVAILEGLVPFGNWWDLFNFAPGQDNAMSAQIYQGILPWYTLPEMKASFFRPLTCVLAAADHALFGRAFELWHVHSLLWHLLLIWAYWLVARRALRGGAGMLAVAIFTLAPSHWFPVVWVANRNALVATVPALLGFYAHMRWREEGWRPGLPLSLLGYAAGLLGGEAALGVLAYLFAYEVFANGRRGAVARARSAAAGLAPVVFVVAAYLAVYKLLGHGSYGSGSYIDPLREPVNYLIHAPGRLLMLVAALLGGFSADMLVFAEWLRPVHAVAGLATAAVFAVGLRSAWPGLDEGERRALKWMTCGGLLSMLPVVATFPTNRLLLAPTIGGSALLAVILRHWWKARQEGRAGKPMTALAVFVIVAHIALPPVVWIGQSLAFTVFGKHVERTCRLAELGGPLPEDGHYVLLPGMDPITSIYSPIILAVLEERKLELNDFWLVTSQAPHDHAITTTGPNRFEMELVDGSMLGSEFERLFRGEEYPLRVGQEVDLGYVLVTVRAMGEVGPSKVEFEFDYPLDDARLAFLAWEDGCVRRVRMPDVGESMVLPWEKGMLNLREMLGQ